MKRIEPFWDSGYKKLNYRKDIFNDEYAIQGWRKQGYQNPIESFSGEMANHGDIQPKWNDDIVKWATEVQELQDVGCCYYRMKTNTIIPNHTDAYNVYTEKFNCTTQQVVKILVFLEDWKSGHYFELEGKPMIQWKAGNYATWNGRTEHFAANIGVEDIYTLQITGHKK